ncbi:S49 family peptidase [soil metagenome]
MSERERTSGRVGLFFRRTLIGLGAMTLLFFVLIFVALLVGRGERLPGRVVLELDLERGLVEYVPDDPISAALSRDQLSVRDVVEALHRASTDDRVVALVARVGAGDIGLAQVEEIRDAVMAFRTSGKPTVLFSETFGEFASGQGGYYLATAFEKIYLQPSGDVGLAGLISANPFFAGTLERIGVEPRMDHRYEYKNALNVFTETEMTEPHREAVEAVLRSSYENIVTGIAAGRNIAREDARRIIDNGPYYGEEAVRAQLVDGLAYRDEVYDSIRAEVGGDPEFLFLRRYLKGAGRPFQSGDGIALIYGTGTVQRGSSDFSPMTGGSAMGSETVTRAFRAAIEDDGIRAILFRVDSPGGSYVASDAIWRETVRARAAGKPVIVSMGNVAGSGGYFVAMAADRIVAHPSTITGSIGVVGGKMLLNELSENVGVTWDDVQVGGNAAMWSTFNDYSPQEWQRVQALLDRIYNDFTAKVAQGRQLSPDSVHAIARGRIWSGADARALGLVDELGGFHVALRLAREAAGLAADAPINLRVYPEERTFLQMLLERGERNSYPTTFGVTASLIREFQPILDLARRAGLLGQRGMLMMPGY